MPKKITAILFIVVSLQAAILMPEAHARDFRAGDRQMLVLSRPEDLVATISENVLREAYQRMGIRIYTEIMPAERALMMANSGRINGEVNRIKGIDKAYPNLIRVPVPINRIEAVVFTRHHVFPVTGWDSLKPYLIGIRRGTKFAEKGTRGFRVQAVDDNAQLFHKLYLGRTDLAVTSRVEGLDLIKKHRFYGIRALEPPLVTLELFHYLHKSRSSMLPKITAVLEDMAKEGRIRAIRDENISQIRD